MARFSGKIVERRSDIVREIKKGFKDLSWPMTMLPGGPLSPEGYWIESIMWISPIRVIRRVWNPSLLWKPWVYSIKDGKLSINIINSMMGMEKIQQGSSRKFFLLPLGCIALTFKRMMKWINYRSFLLSFAFLPLRLMHLPVKTGNEVKLYSAIQS